MKRKASFAAFGLALVLAGCSKAVTADRKSTRLNSSHAL